LPKRELELREICVILGETKAGICFKMHISFVYKGLECGDLQKKQNKDV